MTSICVTACRSSDWLQNIARLPRPCVVVLHNPTPENSDDARQACGGTVIEIHGDFNWCAMANLAAAQAKGLWFWFQHDDLQPPTQAQLEDMVTVLAETGSAIAFPSIDGQCESPMQGADLNGWSHLTEYAGAGGIMIHRSEFWRTGGFFCEMPGFGFWEASKQYAYFRDTGGLAVVCHDVRLKHRGSATSGYIMGEMGRRRAQQEAVRWMAERHGVRLDAFTRTSEPRMVKRVDAVCAVAEEPGYMDVGGVRLSLRGDEDETERLSMAINAAQCDSVDFRGKVYRRFAGGDRFETVSTKDTIRIGMYWGFGMGDAFFIMRAARAMKEAIPELKIAVYCESDRAALMRRCPDVDEVLQVAWGLVPLDTLDLVARTNAFGTENSSRRICDYFSLPYKKQAARYKIEPEDHERGMAALKEAGWKEGQRTVGLQIRGGWVAKWWGRAPQFIRQCHERGWQCVTMGENNARAVREAKDAIHLPPLPIEVVVAILSVLDIFVGFDSGLTHASAAVGTPLVSLWGPHDPGGLLFEADVYNAVALRVRHPGMCGPNHCRQNELGGGSRCPFRDGGMGADCLDEITCAQVWSEIEELCGHQSN